MCSVKIGIIGGTGLENPVILENSSEVTVNTPFGSPSEALKFGTINGVPCVFLSRHGRKHTIGPAFVNYRANIWALKQVGCTHVLVTTTCGSLREDIAPGDIVFIDQFIDRTYKRQTSFYDCTPGGPVGICHIHMYPAFCERTRQVLISAAESLQIKHHKSGTTVTIEGPRFSTKAESNLFRTWGGSVINMTTIPEVILAKEVGLCYAAIALPTDYDCWRDSSECHVSMDLVVKIAKENCHKAVDIIKLAVSQIALQNWDNEIK